MKIPCENCLVFSMCKSKLIEPWLYYKYYNHLPFPWSLYLQCSIVDEFAEGLYHRVYGDTNAVYMTKLISIINPYFIEVFGFE